MRLSIPAHQNHPLKVGLVHHLIKMGGLSENLLALFAFPEDGGCALQELALSCWPGRTTTAKVLHAGSANLVS